MKRKRIIIGGLILLAGFLMVWFLSRSAGPWLEREAAARLLGFLEERPGCDARLGRLSLEFMPARVHLSDLEVNCGSEGQMKLPVVTADFDLLPLLRQRFILRNLQLRDPVVIWHGTPLWDQSVASGTGRSVAGLRVHGFSLRGGHVRLELPGGGGRWEVTGLQASSPGLWDGEHLQVDLQGARLDWNADWLELQDLSVAAHLQWDGENLEADGIEVFAPDGMELTGEGAWTMANADRLSSYRFTGAATLPAGLLRKMALLPAGIAPTRSVSWRGEVAGAGGAWTVRGDLDAGDVVAFSLPLTQARAVDFTFSPGGPLAATLSAVTLDGRVEGRLEGDRSDLGWTVGGELKATDLDLGRIPPAWPWSTALPRPGSRLSGRLAGRVPLDQPGAAGLQATVNLAGIRGRSGVGTLAPSGSLQFALTDGVLSLEASHLIEGEMELTATGQARLDGALDLTATAVTHDLAMTVTRLEEVLDVMVPALGGSLTAGGRLTGTWREPLLTTQFQGDGMVLAGIPLGRFSARLVWRKGGLYLEEATLSGPAVEMAFHGAWSAPGGGPADRQAALTLQAEIARVDLSVLGTLLGRGGMVSGELEGSGELTWSTGVPGVHVDLSGDHLLVMGHPLDEMRLQAVLDGRALHVESFRVRRGEGLLEAHGVLPLESPHSGSPAPESLFFSVENFPLVDQWPGVALAGRLSAAGELSLSLAKPWPLGHLTMAVTDLVVAGWPLPELTATVEMAGEQDHVTVLSAEPGIELTGSLTRTGEFPWSLDGTLHGVQVELPGEMPGLTLGSGRTILTARGRLFDLNSLRGTLSVQELALETPAGPVAAQGALTVTATGRDLQLEPVTVRFGEGEVEILGDGQLASVPSYRMQIVGLLDLARWSFLTGDDVEMAGVAVLDVRLQGVGRAHNIFGDLMVRGGRLRLPRLFPNALDQIEARVRLEGEKIVLESLGGRVGGGRLSATGELELLDWRPGRFRLNLRSERVSARFPRTLRSTTDTELELSGTPGDALLTGRIEVQWAKYEQDFKVENGLKSRTPPSLPPPPGPLDNVRLDLEVVAPGQVWVQNDFARAEFRADLHVGGTASRPVAEGHVDLARRGRLTFRDVDYRIDDAEFIFSPSFPNDPEMNILARTDVSDYTVSLQATGRLSRPRIQLSSEPDLAQDEIIVLLLTGSLPDSTQQAGISSDVLAGYLGGALFSGKALERLTTIDQARIDPVFVEGQGDPTARLTLTERISDRLTASWSTTLGGVQGNTAELRYRILPHLELRTAQEETGASVVEGRYVRSLPSRRQRQYRRERRSDAQEGITRRLGTTVLLGPVTVTGVPSPPGTDVLVSAMGLEAGEEIESSDILQAAAVARELLVDEGYRMARVDCLEGEAPAAQPVPVNCLVEAGPLIELRLNGARRKDDIKALSREIQEEWMEVLERDELPFAAARAAVSWYLERGHAAATATAFIEDGPGGGQVIQVDLVPGPRIRVDKVVLEGIDLLDEKMLRGHLLTTGRVTVRHVLLTPEVVEQDRDTLVRLFAGSGYLDVQVESPEPVIDASNKATVIFTVHAGRPRSINQVIFSGAHAIPVEELETRFGPAPGTTPDPERLEAAATDLQRYYDTRGYVDAGVVWRLERSGAGVVVRFDIRENEQIRIGQVIIQGLEVTVEEIVRREVTLVPGDLLRRAAMQEIQERIRDLDLFRSVVVASRDIPGEPHTRDVLIQVKERDNLALAAGLGFDNEEGVRVSFSLGNRNFLGRGGALSFQARLSGDIKSGELRNGWRRIGGSRNDFLGAVSLSRRDRQGFGEEREALVLQLSRPRSARTTIQMRYRIENFNLFDVETFGPVATATSLAAAFVEEGRLGSLGASVVRKTFDVPALPRDGAIRTIDLSVYSESLGSDFEYVRFFVKQGRVWSSADNDVAYLLTANVGLMWPYGDTEVVPLAERFFIGGISSVRGYEQDRLGPVDPTTLEPVGGESLFVLNNELRFHVTTNISARLFLDAGNVFLQAGDFDLGDLKYTAGPGLSYDTPVGPLRIYYGFKLNREDDESRGRFHLTFGAVF